MSFFKSIKDLIGGSSRGGSFPYDPEKHYAVIRSSICTGERVAGFKSYADGHFTDVMLIRSPEDEERFKRLYGLEKVKIEY